MRGSPHESEHAQRDLARLLGVPYHEQRRLEALTAHWVVRHHPWAVPAVCILWWLVGFACGVLWPRL